jgi:hypothetical protein
MHKPGTPAGKFFEFRCAKNHVAAFGQAVKLKCADDPFRLDDLVIDAEEP